MTSPKTVTYARVSKRLNFHFWWTTSITRIFHLLDATEPRIWWFSCEGPWIKDPIYTVNLKHFGFLLSYIIAFLHIIVLYCWIDYLFIIYISLLNIYLFIYIFNTYFLLLLFLHLSLFFFFATWSSKINKILYRLLQKYSILQYI